MRKMLENRLQRKLAAFLPGYIVQCSFAADGVVTVAIEKPATGECWYIAGIAMQSLIGAENLAQTVEQILVEVEAAGEETPLLLTKQENGAA